MFLTLILAHLSADFMLQWESLCRKKESPDWPTKLHGHLLHITIYFICNLILVSIANQFNFKILLVITILTALHFIIDLGKTLANEINKLLVFCLDQLLHLVLIVLATWWYSPDTFMDKLNLLADINSLSPQLVLLDKLWIILISLVLATSVSNVVIRLVVSSIRQGPGKDELRTGRYIGSLERILTIMAVIAGSYESVIAIYASKTAIRFKRASEPDFEEYYIVGTLTSAFLGLWCGLIVRTFV